MLWFVKVDVYDFALNRVILVVEAAKMHALATNMVIFRQLVIFTWCDFVFW